VAFGQGLAPGTFMRRVDHHAVDVDDEGDGAVQEKAPS
jgi:hypothetical protein